MIVTQDDIDILRQGSQTIYLKVELCDSSLKILDSLTGVILSDSLSVDNSSQQRRSYSCDIAITDSSFDIGKDKKIWHDKRLRVYYGVRSVKRRIIVWYRIGTFAYTDMKYTYSQTDRKLSLSCADLMSLYDGTLNGQLPGYGSSNSGDGNTEIVAATGLKIPAGEDIRKSIIGVLDAAGITSYVVEDIGKEIPYDLEFNTGVTYAEVWKTIAELYDSWEYFFDVDGVFIWRKIPTCLNDPVILSDDIMQDVVIDENPSLSFTGIYNVTEVWGKVLELSNTDRYAETCTYENNTYKVNFTEYEKWEDLDNLTMIAIKIPSNNEASPKFTIGNFSSIPILDGNGDELKENILLKDTVYVFRYRRMTVDENNTIVANLYLLGQYQCKGRYEETSKDYPFSTTNLGYEIINSVDYSGLSDDAACYNQAEYLTYKSTIMMDTIDLTTLVIPWLDVNMKVEYTPQYNKQKNQYIIKNFSWSFGSGTMSITLYKFVEDFSYVYNNKNRKLVSK